MCIKFYDDANNVGMIEIPDDKKVESLDITILSGDETGYIFLPMVPDRSLMLRTIV